MEILLQSLLLGLLGGLVPGAILTILFVSVLQGGVQQGLKAFSWALLAELVVAGLLVTMVLSLPVQEWVFYVLGIVGSLVLVYFAYGIWSISSIRTQQSSDKVYSPQEILLLSATNAPLYIFWLTVCIPLIQELFSSYSVVAAAILYMTAFEIGWATSTLGVMLIFAWAKRHLNNPCIVSWVYRCVSILMLLFAFRMVYLSLSNLGII